MLLLRGATIKPLPDAFQIAVSIHAPLARSNRGGDADCADARVSIHAPLARSNTVAAGTAERDAVSIHAPLARSNSARSSLVSLTPFQYMLLLRGATESSSFRPILISVSIHAPLARSNCVAGSVAGDSRCFNTCSSCEEQRSCAETVNRASRFNTCSSCEEQRL